jgi:hypothetical protein
MQTILGTDDAVSVCDCCGKTGLKFTFAVDVDGEVLHYGSTCVTKWTGRTAAQANKEVADRETARIAKLEAAHRATVEYLQLQVKMKHGLEAGLCGKAFKEFCAVERATSDAKRAEIFVL